ncbi:multiple epidermal growth factor-like domains protein 10 [Mercenaria mercenaria]|uniref:multiple epidermal growth factor-like domains protein 10 n=1 Tax=Mercenaria mercenaria TaxID=6596 RepID=UPI00234F44DA|nr:multiple epidermal growth factor-like domains protein 10 [Mercenaria mercenaria]
MYNQCEYGKYGTDCNITCPSGCNGTCKDNGDCHNYKTGFTRSKCDQCVGGKYGINCEHDCPKTCALATCDSTTGVCNDGCRIDYYGEQCNMMCATTCLPDDEGTRCFYTNGSCVKDCQNGYHGDMCQDRCSENCINIICTRANGVCKLGCVGEFKGNDCTEQIISDCDNTADSSNVGPFIGVGVGPVAVTLVAVGIFIIIRRYLRHGHVRQHKPEDAHELTDNIHDNVKTTTALPNVQTNTNAGYENTQFPAYEELKESKNESSTYDSIDDTSTS